VSITCIADAIIEHQPDLVQDNLMVSTVSDGSFAKRHGLDIELATVPQENLFV